MTVICSDAKIVSKVAANLVSRSRIKNRRVAVNWSMRLRACWVDEVAGLLVGPLAGRVGGDPGEVDASAVEFDEEQDVEPSESDGVDGEEVTCEHLMRLCVEELAPGGSAPLGTRVNSGLFEDRPNRRRREPIAETDEFAVDAPITPSPVLGREAQDQRAQRVVDAGPSRRPVCRRPVPGDEVTMPAHQRVGRDEEHRPTLPIQNTAQPGEQHPIARLEARPWDLMLEDLELFAQHEDLDVFGPIPTAPQHEQRHDAAEQFVHNRHDRHPRDHRAMVTNAQVGDPIEFSAPTGSGTRSNVEAYVS
jgi:hypothetical protein